MGLSRSISCKICIHDFGSCVCSTITVSYLPGYGMLMHVQRLPHTFEESTCTGHM
jgi:hypothetical protein